MRILGCMYLFWFLSPISKMTQSHHDGWIFQHIRMGPQILEDGIHMNFSTKSSGNFKKMMINQRIEGYPSFGLTQSSYIVGDISELHPHYIPTVVVLYLHGSINLLLWLFLHGIYIFSRSFQLYIIINIPDLRVYTSNHYISISYHIVGDLFP